MFKLAQSFFQSVVPGVVKPLHILWNEVIGFMFMALAVPAIGAAYRAYQGLATDSKDFGRLVMSVLFSVMMVGFGVSSFLKARRIRRRGLTTVKS